MDNATIFADIVNSRRSVRGFLPKPVDQETLKTVFNLAHKAPSNCNTQPWEVYVVSGDKLEALRKALPEALMQGEYSMDFPFDGKYEGVYQDRQYDAANQLYSALGIDRKDKEKRGEAFMDNYRFFGAPHVAFVFLPEPFGIRESGDLGMFAQTLMLALTAHGLASCPQTALSFNPHVVREHLGIADNNKLLFGISFGYEDTENPANQCRVSRSPLDETVHFID